MKVSRSCGPPDVDGAEVPAVRMAHVQEVAVRRFAPLEHGRLIPGRAADRQELELLEQAEARHLRDNRNVRKHITLSSIWMGAQLSLLTFMSVPP